MKNILIGIFIAAAAIAGIAILKYSPFTSAFLWNISDKGAWLLPLILAAALLDSVHPCSFSILLITIAFLFGMQLPRKKILLIGGIYIAGIFIAYLFIGLGLLKTLSLFNTPHFMGKLGATLLVLFGVINIANELFPKFPIKLKLPSGAYAAMGKLMERVSIPAAFFLGLLVGVCQFPCMGGPYLMVIGLLHDYATYLKGFAYLVLYNLILILPLSAVLWISANKIVVEKITEWKRTNMYRIKLWAGIAMVAFGLVIFFL